MEQVQGALQLMWNFWPLLFLSGMEGAWKGRAQAIDVGANALKFTAITWGIFVFIRLDLWLFHYPVQPILPEVFFWWSGALLAGVYAAYMLRQKTRAHRQALLAARLDELRNMETAALVEHVAEALRRQGCQVQAAPPESDWHLLVTCPDGESQALILRAGDHSVGKPALLALYNALPETGASLGLFLTPGDFTPAARQWAQDRPLRLLDGEAMVEFLEDGGVFQKDRQTKVS